MDGLENLSIPERECESCRQRPAQEFGTLCGQCLAKRLSKVRQKLGPPVRHRPPFRGPGAREKTRDTKYGTNQG